MSQLELVPRTSSPPMSACPECSGGLAVLKVIPGRVGRGGCEYWTMRCTNCGSIHLDIIEPPAQNA